ncbi:DgyrCDS5543 [Dimorphilus gyrociliatus]|uniref:Translocation protein SEC62 n=1 Tax=Dimorphilus gyrociliatus TaxID=2664684 RepID=A0A7I8VK85_9ANNE|nr:DgyrCDS5543 [Dimorphilus gyrociliatus]
MAERKRQKKGSEDEHKRTKQETEVAKFLRFNVPVKEGKIADVPGMVVTYFTAKDAVDYLMDSKWASKKPILFTDRASCVNYCQTLLIKETFQRLEKKKRSKKKEDELDNKIAKKKSKKKDKEESETEKEKKDSKSKKDGKKKKKKMIHFALDEIQEFKDGENYYAWTYDPVPLKAYVIGTLMVLGAIGVCLYPLWPLTVRQGVYYLSLAAAVCIGIFIVLCILRTIIFALVWLTTMGEHHLWILPNLTEDCGFFESFKPFYSHSLAESSKKKLEDSKNKKSKDEENKKTEKSDEQTTAEETKKDNEDDKQDESEEDEQQVETTDNGYEILDDDELAEFLRGEMDKEIVKHRGSCHCKAVTFEVLAPEIVDVFHCNCTICVKKQGWHFMVPKENFQILSGEDKLSTYKFNTGTASHLFCKECGIHSFYYSRSHQTSVAIMPHCIDSGTIKKENIVHFDGLNWEKSYTEAKEKKGGHFN